MKSMIMKTWLVIQSDLGYKPYNSKYYRNQMMTVIWVVRGQWQLKAVPCVWTAFYSFLPLENAYFLCPNLHVLVFVSPRQI